MAIQKIEGLDKLLRQFDSLKKIDKKKIGMAGAEELYDKTQDNCPIDTGELKSTGKVKGTETGGVVSYETPYVVYVEMDKHPFIRPSIDENMNVLSKACRDKAQQLIKEAV